jgi:ribosomal 50S subunit-recycling heat shock protein
VSLNGHAAKPSHAVKPGDRVTLRTSVATRTLELLELPRAGLTRERAHALVREVAGG